LSKPRELLAFINHEQTLLTKITTLMRQLRLMLLVTALCRALERITVHRTSDTPIDHSQTVPHVPK
jgi:hypothetical protein